jgi:site-specific recombinase XerD
MATVNFLYRSTRDYAPLKIRFLYRYRGVDYQFESKTKIWVEKNYWFNDHNANRRDVDIVNKQTQINGKIGLLKRLVLNEFNRTNENLIIETINKEWLNKIVYDYYNPKVKEFSLPRNLVGYFKSFIELKKQDLSVQTVKNYKVVLKLVVRFENSFSRQIFLNEINEDFKLQFMKFGLRENYAIGTISRALGSIKTVCNHAKRKGLEIHPETEGLRIKVKPNQVIYLTTGEIKKISEVKLNKEHLKIARDWLLISCYTGQRVSDFMNFRSEMIRKEKENYLIDFVQYKTEKRMTVGLHSKVLEILTNYDDEFPPKVHPQKLNKYVKEVCREARINKLTRGRKRVEIEKGSKAYRKVEGIYEKWELVSAHIGRRSFASNFYATDMPTSLIKQTTGHSSEATLLKYIGKSNKDTAIEIFKYF